MKREEIERILRSHEYFPSYHKPEVSEIFKNVIDFSKPRRFDRIVLWESDWEMLSEEKLYHLMNNPMTHERWSVLSGWGEGNG